MLSVKPKFELRAPSAQTAIDLFAGGWASDLGPVLGVQDTGAAKVAEDRRPGYALKSFAGPDGTFAGQRILELGPLEAGQSWRLEQMGADVVAVEANAEAYLKCLVVKELLGLTRVRFLFGDFLKHLAETDERYDLIFASGVLYHLSDPLELIRLAALRTSRLFLWTHVFQPGIWRTRTQAVERDGLSVTYHQRRYRARERATFLGGNRPTASLLERDDLLRALAHYGFSQHAIHREQTDAQSGPSVSLCAWKDSET